MPFVQRAVEPKFLSRTSLRDNDGQPRVADEELQAVTNCTLSNALRQLASLVLLAEDIFSELTVQLQDITERSKVAQTKIIKINELVEQYDPKKVPVRPFRNLITFSLNMPPLQKRTTLMHYSERYLKTCLSVRTDPRWEKKLPDSNANHKNVSR
ncbi:hypothetical protein SFRURICE_002971 [Spodoptera frugiperda]|uniref:SFRICE_030903 n=1 Tax=Spodoptera frugiperda TaxID=7108 RepID=A0A2H1W6Z4_SPOFR|nr:hypothetical protein SFRURICE_002971 [Spodoptera frugiperda]